MMNEKELKKLVRHLKKEYIEALQRGNSKIQDNIKLKRWILFGLP